MSISRIQIPQHDNEDDRSDAPHVWVALKRATLAEIVRHVAMRRRSIARLTILLAEAHGNRKQITRIKHAIDRHAEHCVELEELVQAAQALGVQPDDVVGKVIVPRGRDQPHAVHWC